MSELATLDSPRRSFLARLAAGAAAIGLAGLTTSAADAQNLVVTSSPPSSDDIESWPGNLRARHRQVVDAVNPNEGFPLGFALTFLNANNQASRIPDSNLGAVVVLRHMAMPMALTDAAWEKYKIGELLGVKDPATKEPATRNIFYHSRDGDIEIPDMAIDKLLARGVRFGACNVALTILSGMRASVAGVDANTAKDEWTAAVIPGISIIPSGTWGVNRAQEKGCTYVYGG